MAASLGLPAPDRLTWSQIDTSTYARLSGIWDPPQRHGLRPAAPTILPSGDRVLFTGWLDNRQEIAIRLGIEDRDAAWVYGHAVDRWGDEADLHVIGEYCAVTDRPRMAEVRLVRSPLCAPPLHYHRSALGIAAASVPRALFALGLPVELDEGRLAMQLHAAAYDAEGGWYKGIEALQPGVIVTASRDVERRVPVEQLMRDGESRFLARRMGIGRLPEEIRTETRYGLQHGDWHLRLGRQLGSLKAELKSLEHDPQVGRLVDIPRLIRLLEDFPASDRVERNVALQYQITLPNGIAAARLIRSVSGRND